MVSKSVSLIESLERYGKFKLLDNSEAIKVLPEDSIPVTMMRVEWLTLNNSISNTQEKLFFEQTVEVGVGQFEMIDLFKGDGKGGTVGQVATGFNEADEFLFTVLID